jgi:type I restriction enzyme R subunit
MRHLSISEAGTVQFPMVAHAVAIGWDPVTPELGKLKRGGEDGMLFRDELEAKLGKFNPWLSDDQVRQIVEKLDALPPSIEGNREMLAWLRGERQWHDESERRSRHIQIIDFERPAENELQVTWEWKLKPPARKGNRADVMFLINGIPVCIVEHKNPKDGGALNRAVTQLRRYEIETPELIGAAQLFNVTHLLDYWYGVTWSANRRTMARWKQQRDESYRFAVQAFFEPTDFLRTLQHWILFYVEDGETRKSVLRQHQRVAIYRILDRCEDVTRKRGLIWHTQGSGKTFTLLTAARLILEDKERYRNATVILVVDRTELEGQLKGWVEKLLGEMQQQDIPVWRATSGSDVEEMLRTDKRGLIISMIHKFDGIGKDANARDNVYVFIDEAHRSVAHDLGSYLMAAVPNATIIGFTGTPIAQTEQGKGTFKIFGAQDAEGYLDKYSIRESIQDGTTLPIRHSMAPSEVTVPAEQLEREFLELAAAEGVTDVEELNRVLERAVGLRTFLTADDRVQKVARFIAEHFREKVEPLGLKAFVVGVNREACAKYKRALDALLPAGWSEVVYTSNPNDVVERPLVAELQLSDDRETDVRALFKKPSESPKILIVTDKLLTGYDAPVLYCMYLDKPMRDHVLLQAIARVNRPYVDENGVQKKVGLVVDFVGVLRELKKALKFDSSDVSGVIEDLDLLLKDLLTKLDQARSDFLDAGEGGSADERVERLVYGRFLEPEARKAFFDSYKDIEALWEILSPSAELRDHIETYGSLARLYATVRNAYANQVVYTTDLEYKTAKLVQESVASHRLGTLVKTVTFDVRTLEGLRAEPGSDEAKVFNLIRGLNHEIDENEDLAPALLSLKERSQRIIEDLEQRTTTGLAAMDRLAALAAERDKVVQAARESGLSPKAFALFWRLKDERTLAERGIDAKQLAVEAEALSARFANASENPDERRQLRAALYRPLLALETKERGWLVDVILGLLLDRAGSRD